MKHKPLLGLVGSLAMSFGCGGAPPASEVTILTDSTEAAAETEAELAETMRREGEILQAAFDAMYTPEEQASLLAQSEREASVDFSGSLSVDEQRAIQARFAAQGIATERVSFWGRMVSVDQSDALYHADDLLQEGGGPAHEVEKNYVFAAIHNPEAAYNSGAIAPELFARMSGSNFQFLRPVLSRADTTSSDGTPVRRRYYLVVFENGVAAPSSFLTALRGAATDLESANDNSSDCLIPGTFNVITQAQWDAFPAGSKAYHYQIRVRFGPNGPGVTNDACANTSYACAIFPRRITKSFSTPSARMSFGSYLGVVSNGPLITPPLFDGVPQPTSPQDLRELLTHELGHIIGLSHPFNDSFLHLRVPGTASRNQDPNSPGSYESVMDSDAQNGQPISADDRLALRKLYPAGNDCRYTDTFQTIQ